MMSKRFAPGIVVGAALMLATGCGAAASGAGMPINNATDETAAAEIYTPAFVPGPLDEFWGQVSTQPRGSVRQMWEQTVAAHLAAEEQTAACMAALGFEYVIQPEPLIGRPFIMAELPWTAPYGSREWVEFYGFGLSTAEWFADATGAPPDPDSIGRLSDALLAQMSSSEQEAWLNALYGSLGGPYWGELDLDSCHGAAQATMWWNQDITPSSFELLLAEIEQLQLSIWEGTAAPIRELDFEWQSCFVATGLSEGWESPGQLLQDIQSEWASLQNALRWAPDLNRHAEFSAREIALAVADSDCRIDIDYESRHRTIDHQLQLEFVDRRRGELENWVIYVAESRQS